MKNLISNIFIYILLMQWIRKMCKIERLIFLFFFFFIIWDKLRFRGIQGTSCRSFFQCSLLTFAADGIYQEKSNRSWPMWFTFTQRASSCRFGAIGEFAYPHGSRLLKSQKSLSVENPLFSAKTLQLRMNIEILTTNLGSRSFFHLCYLNKLRAIGHIFYTQKLLSNKSRTWSTPFVW